MLALNESGNNVSPCLERGALFFGEAVPLIYADDPREGAARVIQHLLDHRQVDAEPRHAGCDGPA